MIARQGRLVGRWVIIHHEFDIEIIQFHNYKGESDYKSG